jgi:radical SAM superfamily enzyme YgiQ (UPF0313 family)
VTDSTLNSLTDASEQSILADQTPNPGGDEADGIVLAGWNARFSHTCLAIRYLKNHLFQHWPAAPRTDLFEWTINDPPAQIIQQLYLRQARLYAFSCYIWNISLVARISSQLKKVLPGVRILWGGPEVSYDAKQRLLDNKAVDFIIRGEGETAFLALCRALFSPSGHFNEGFAATPGLTWRDPENGRIRENPAGPLLDGAAWPFAYAQPELAGLANRIIYYETSRGCPYRCIYCLSALDKTVRYRPLEKVFAELQQLLVANPLQVKLVDRTFNCQPDRAREIWHFLIKKQQQNPDCRTRFHFEAAADLLDTETIELLNTAPPGLFKLEIGIQTIHPEILKAIDRPFRADKAQGPISRLRQAGRVHLHLDLIAGLPGETLALFAESFNWVYQLHPQQLQLGFLKILPGSPMHCQAASRGFAWQDEPPYEVLRSDALSYADLNKLKSIAALLELYHNSQLFTRSLPWIVARWPDPFSFFTDFAAWPPMAGCLEKPLAPPGRARLLWQFAAENDMDLGRKKDQSGTDWLAAAWLGLLRSDYLAAGHKDQPDWLGFWESSADSQARAQIARLRGLYRQRFPNCRRFLLERYPFNWESLIASGQLVPGEWLACYDLSGQQPVLLDTSSPDTLY